MSPIPSYSRSSETPSSTSLRRNRYLLLLDNGRFHPTNWQLELLDTEETPSGTTLSQSLPQRLRPGRYQPEQFVPRQFAREKRRGGGGSSSSGSSRGSSSSSSGGYRAPAPLAAPKPASKPATKLPAPAPPAKKPVPPPHRPNPQPPASHPKPAPGTTPAKSPKPKPKPANGSSDIKPNAGIPANAHDKPNTSGGRPPNKPPNIPSPSPHTPFVGHNPAPTSHKSSNHLHGCNATCRAAVIGTVGAIALLGLLCLLVFCIIRRKRIHKTRAVVRILRSKSKVQTRSFTGREWWKHGRQKSSVSEDGWELTASENYMASGVSFAMSHASLDSHQAPTWVRRAASPITDEETPKTPMHSRERRTAVQAVRRVRSDESTLSCPAMMTARSRGSPCSSCLHEDPHPRTQVSHTRASGARSPLSVGSDESSWDDPILGTAQRATVFQHPQPIQTIAGMQSFQARHCALQRRGARRKSDRPDMSGSCHQSESGRTSASGDESTYEDACSEPLDEESCNGTDDDESRDVMEDSECERGRTSYRISYGSTRRRKEQRF